VAESKSASRAIPPISAGCHQRLHARYKIGRLQIAARPGSAGVPRPRACARLGLGREPSERAPTRSWFSKSGGRSPSVSGITKSGTAACSQGVSIALHASVKNAGARSASALASPALAPSNRGSSTASCAATVMPCPHPGLKRQIAWPNDNSPRGNACKRSKCRQTLTGKPNCATSLSRVARRIRGLPRSSERPARRGDAGTSLRGRACASPTPQVRATRERNGIRGEINWFGERNINLLARPVLP
jgi:hypothetical protein